MLMEWRIHFDQPWWDCICRVLCPVLGSTVKGEYGQTVERLAEATRVVRGLEMPSREKLRKLGVFSLEKRQFSTDLPAFFSYLRRGCREEGMKLFLEVISNRARDNGKKLQFRKFRLAIQKTFSLCGWSNAGTREISQRGWFSVSGDIKT